MRNVKMQKVMRTVAPRLRRDGIKPTLESIEERHLERRWKKGSNENGLGWNFEKRTVKIEYVLPHGGQVENILVDQVVTFEDQHIAATKRFDLKWLLFVGVLIIVSTMVVVVVWSAVGTCLQGSAAQGH